MLTGTFASALSSSLAKNNGYISKFSGGSSFDAKVIYLPSDPNNFYLVTRNIEIRKFSIKTGLPITTYTYSPSLSIHDVVVDGSSNIYISGSSGTTLYIIKINSSMSIVWQKTISNTYVPYSEGALRVDANGNVYTTYYDGSDFSVYYCHLTKLDSAGNYQWNRQLTSSNNKTSMQPLAIDSSGYIYVAGYYSGSSAVAALMKFDSNGSHYWTTTIDEPSNWDAFLNEVQVDSSGNIYAFGFSDAGGRRALIVKFSSSGSVVWQKTIGASIGESVGPGSFVISEDNIYLNMFGPVVNGYNVATIIKLNLSGTKQYERHLQFANTSVYTQFISTIGTHIYMSGYQPFGFIFKAPKDGSKTGTYNSFGNQIDYKVPAIQSTEQNTSYQVGSGGISVSSVSKTVSNASGSITEQPTFTSAVSRRF